MTKAKSKSVAKNTSAVVERNFKLDSGETSSEDEEIISVQTFITDPAEVEVGIALTMNLGNFESAKLSVHLRVPCYAEEKDEAFDFAQRWVEERVSKERDLIRRHQSGDANPL
jgi:hypothetical protein